MYTVVVILEIQFSYDKKNACLFLTAIKQPFKCVCHKLTPCSIASHRVSVRQFCNVSTTLPNVSSGPRFSSATFLQR